ncbi:hypothetical protein VOLCADRAFT_107772 [Volvox carteri f. nagariensis]|uniref:Uncharacterized protein n=1 Tax=Volvox carteri f. nagariensis TaxID=3068 RepID=D8UGA6_VOLCA|nr:uncharacterized protein VOLCADRAFT_107772 [Volvox carteri f. nagariensis]EFJ41227.1 hypothetical protein VOLCADRAFT_107772 [Volvox carteri f. nagariensis]|eukprot:XP_002957678.1 hypothetical protein VOLCADRAFT_107772 [Volvox carteri f. nagariensis]
MTRMGVYSSFRCCTPDRQVAAGGKTAAAAPPPRATRPAAAPPAAATDTGPGGGGGGEAAGISSPPRPPLPPPRRFFGATPPPHAPVTDLGPVPPPDHESALPAVADGLGSETGNVVDSDLEEDQAYQKVTSSYRNVMPYRQALRSLSAPALPSLRRHTDPAAVGPGPPGSPAAAPGGLAGGGGGAQRPPLRPDVRGVQVERKSDGTRQDKAGTFFLRQLLELTALGVGDADVAAALVHVFGPTRRIRLSGPTTSPEELEVREALLEAARRHVGLQHKPQTSHRNHHHDDEELPPPQQHQHQYQYQYQYQGTAAMEESFYGDRSYATAATAAASASSSSTTIETVAAAFGTSSSRTTSSSASASAADDADRSADEWKARVKEQNMQRRRLSSWLQYRGHDMGVVLKVFELLGI